MCFSWKKWLRISAVTLIFYPRRSSWFCLISSPIKIFSWLTIGFASLLLQIPAVMGTLKIFWPLWSHLHLCSWTGKLYYLWDSQRRRVHLWSFYNSPGIHNRSRLRRQAKASQDRRFSKTLTWNVYPYLTEANLSTQSTAIFPVDRQWKERRLLTSWKSKCRAWF